MPILVKGDDVRRETKGNASHGQLWPVQAVVNGLNVKKYAHLTTVWILTSVCNLLHLCNKLCFRYPICFLTKTNPYNPEIQTLIPGKTVTVNV